MFKKQLTTLNKQFTFLKFVDLYMSYFYFPKFLIVIALFIASGVIFTSFRNPIKVTQIGSYLKVNQGIVFLITSASIKQDGQKSSEYGPMKLFLKEVGRLAGYSQQTKQFLLYPFENQSEEALKVLQDKIRSKFPQAEIVKSNEKESAEIIKAFKN